MLLEWKEFLLFLGRVGFDHLKFIGELVLQVVLLEVGKCRLEQQQQQQGEK